MEGPITLNGRDFDTVVVDRTRLGGFYYMHKFHGDLDWYGMSRPSLLAVTIEYCPVGHGLDVSISEVEQLTPDGAKIRQLEPSRCTGLGDDPDRAIRMAYRIAGELKSGYAQ